MTESNGLFENVLRWLRAGYPDGVPPKDYYPVLALLKRSLTEDEVVEAAHDTAHAQMRLYYARRIIRSGTDGATARGHLAAAMRADPTILVRRPAAIAALFAASIHPRATITLMTKTRSLVRA